MSSVSAPAAPAAPTAPELHPRSVSPSLTNALSALLPTNIWDSAADARAARNTLDGLPPKGSAVNKAQNKAQNKAHDIALATLNSTTKTT